MFVVDQRTLKRVVQPTQRAVDFKQVFLRSQLCRRWCRSGELNDGTAIVEERFVGRKFWRFRDKGFKKGYDGRKTPT